MSPSRILLSTAILGTLATACERRPNPPPAPAPVATVPASRPAVPAATPPDVAPPAPVQPAEDPTRFLAYDRQNLRRHVALLGFVRKARAQLEKAAQEQQGKKNGAARILALQAAQRQPIAAQARALRALDPDGEHSYVSGDHDTNLHYLADEYPAAIVGALSGDPGPLAELRTEMDKVEKKIDDWLQRVRQAP